MAEEEQEERDVRNKFLGSLEFLAIKKVKGIQGQRTLFKTRYVISTYKTQEVGMQNLRLYLLSHEVSKSGLQCAPLHTRFCCP